MKGKGILLAISGIAVFAIVAVVASAQTMEISEQPEDSSTTDVPQLDVRQSIIIDHKVRGTRISGQSQVPEQPAETSDIEPTVYRECEMDE